MGRRVNPEKPSEFDEPHRYATWVAPRSEQYKTHATLGHAKNAIAGAHRSNRDVLPRAYVYEWTPDTGWVELYRMDGEVKTDHPLWKIKTGNKRSIQPPSQKAIDAAIASITNA